jgi:aerobic carbon-monoxide dehydrogenase medium subunit
MTLPQFEYRAPKSVDEAVALRQEFGDDAVIMAGGLTTVILLRERLIRPRVVVSLSDIPSLHRIDADSSGLHIGAMNTYNEVARSESVRTIAPLLGEACSHVGSPAIRNMGTIGGNVSHGDGASDVAPALLALGAQATLVGPKGQRIVPLEEFFLGVFSTAIRAEEVLTALHVPRPLPATQTRFKKYTSRSEEAFSTVTVAISAAIPKRGSCADIRIGLGSVAPKPIRAMQAEQMLRNRKITPELITAAASAAAAATDPSSGAEASADYRRSMTNVWVHRMLDDMFAT